LKRMKTDLKLPVLGLVNTILMASRSSLFTWVGQRTCHMTVPISPHLTSNG
jgi:hypothetical protein